MLKAETEGYVMKTAEGRHMKSEKEWLNYTVTFSQIALQADRHIKNIRRFFF